MEDAEAPPFELNASTDTWTLTDRVHGFELVVHPTSSLAARLRMTAIGLALAAAVVWVVVDVGRARGISLGPLIYGALGGLAGGVLSRLGRVWRSPERLVYDGRRLSQEVPRKRTADETRSVHLGPVVEVEAEPRHLADGLRLLGGGLHTALTIHTEGRTMSVGLDLPPSEVERVVAEIATRVAPELQPVPGRPGTVHRLIAPRRTGGNQQRRYTGRQRTMPVDTNGGGATFVLVTSLIALFVAGAVTLSHVARGTLPGGLWTTSLALGVAGVVTLLPRHGLVDRWRQRELEAARAPGTGRPDEPWTWRGRWPDGRVRRTTPYRLAYTSATYGLPVVGGLIAWAGAPGTPLLVPLWIGLVGLALAPMALYLWQLAFAGTTEVRVPEMPLIPGGVVELRFGLSHGAAPFESIAFRLIRTQRRQSSELVPFARYWTTHEGVYHLPDDTPPPGPNEEVPVLFDIPADVGGTDEDGLTVIRWFLEVRGVTSAGPYIEAFPVPVFDAVADVENHPDDVTPR